MISKSAYLAGLQCELRLWSRAHRPDRASAPDDAAESRRREGIEVGAHARTLYAGGQEVRARDWSEALDETRRLVADPSVPALFEAAFAGAGGRARVDVLERSADGWTLHEVKSATRVRGDHVDDVAFQLVVLEASGLEVRRADVVHIDPDYVRGDGGIDWTRLLRSTDVTARARDRMEDVRADLERLGPVAERPEPPEIEPSEQCRRPQWCEFWEHCTRAKPDDWIGRFPGLTGARLVWLQQQGVERAHEIPDDFPLTARQQRARQALAARSEAVALEMADALAGFGPPAHYLDFETWSPAVPRWPGLRPYRQVPFQWSLHSMAADGSLVHREFLADGRSDPRPAFTTTLLEALGDDSAPVLVYSRFEDERLTELARDLPAHARAIGRLRRRLGDLYAVVRESVYHPDFLGSFSLKRVAPVLAPGFGYGDLAGIADGAAAVVALGELVEGTLEPARRQALLDYCERDTLALVELHRALRRRAGLS